MEQRGGGSSVFELMVRNGSCNFLFFARNRHTFICQLTGEISLEKESNFIQAFSEKYAVAIYMYHFAYLNMMKQKRERDRREKAERKSNLTYEDVEWGKLLSKLLRIC